MPRNIGGQHTAFAQHSRNDIARPGTIDDLPAVGVHLEYSSYILAPVPGTVKHPAALFKHSLINTQKIEIAMRIARDLERELHRRQE